LPEEPGGSIFFENYLLEKRLQLEIRAIEQISQDYLENNCEKLGSQRKFSCGNFSLTVISRETQRNSIFWNYLLEKTAPSKNTCIEKSFFRFP
jgi:hypothetical protein